VTDAAAPPTPAAPAPTGPATISSGDDRLGRSAAVITAWNAISRLTGFARVLAVAAALGATFLGNTYQSANLVSNLLFDLLAAGLLAVPLVPAFVELHDLDLGEDAERLAGTLLSLALVVLGAVTVVVVLAAHPVMRLLTAGVGNRAVRAREVDLGAFWLWFFVPQVVLYAVGAVATGVLNARRQFAAAAAAPVANNIVVVATMVLFLALRHRYHAGLDLAFPLKLLLAAGTTVGVLAMTLVPVAALRRSGLRLRPRWRLDDPRLGEVARSGAWGAVFLAGTQLVLGVTLVLANRVAGGVVAYQVAWLFVLLPHALLAHPLFTALYPRLSAQAHRHHWDRFARDVAAGTRVTATLVLPATAVLIVAGPPAIRLVRAGQLDLAGARLVGKVLVAYAAGLAGYSVLLLLVRAATAAGEARLAAGVGALTFAAAATAMAMASAAVHGDNRVVVLGVAHSAAMVAGAAGLFHVLRRRLPAPGPPVASAVLRLALAAGVGVAAGAVTVAAIGGAPSRAHDLAAVAAGALATLAAMLLVLSVLGVPERRMRSWRHLLELP
jgi:putative peptidoglycan lipid II flippase